MTEPHVLHVPSAEHPTIGSALQALAATEAGGTVRVAAGVYREGTLLVSRGASLVGAGPDTVLEGDATVLVCDGAVLLSDMSVRQLSVDHPSAAYGIELRGGSTRVERCRVSAACRTKLAAGILARGATAAPHLLECCVHDCGGAGVLLASKAQADARQTEVRDCRGCGAVATPGTELRMQECTLRACAESALVVGGRAFVEHGTIDGCGGASGVASVVIKGGGSLRMSHSRVERSCGMGVQLGEGADAVLTQNELIGCAKASVAARGAGRLLLEDCVIGEGAAAGVMLMGRGADTLVRGNTVRGCAKAGIQISDGACPSVERNTVCDGGGVGIYVFGGARGIIDGNAVRGSSGVGIKVEDSAPVVRSNTVSEGADAGVMVSGCAPCAAAEDAMAHPSAHGAGPGTPEVSAVPSDASWDIEAQVREVVDKALQAGRQKASEAAPGESTTTVTVPKGHRRGTKLQVRLPDGVLHSVDVPEGAGPLSTFEFKLPAATRSAAGGTDGTGVGEDASQGGAVEEGDEAIDLELRGRIAGAVTAAHAVAEAAASSAWGQALLEANHVIGNAKAGIVLSRGACAHLERNTLRDGKGAGLLVCGGARGVARRNEVRGHAKTQVQICDAGTAPLLEENEVHAGHAGGVLVYGNGGGVLRANRVHGHAQANVRLTEGATCTLEGNVVHEGEDCGVVLVGCSCLVTRNEIHHTRKAGLLAHGDATAPLLVANKIHHSHQAGVYAYDGSSAALVGNEIASNFGAGVLVTERAAPLLLHNRIYGGDDAGVLAHDDARGTLRGNNIYNNRTYAVTALGGGRLTLRRNWLHGARQGGILVDEGGSMEVEDNEIEANAKSGVMLRNDASARLRRNRIRDGRDAGVHVLKGASGELEDNDIFGNEQAGVAVESGGCPTIRNNRIHSGRRSGVLFFEGGMGTMRGNVLWGNDECGVQITEGSDPLVQANRILQQGAAPKTGEVRPATEGSPAVWVHSAGRGTIDDNEVTKSLWHGVVVGQAAAPLLTHNRVHANKKAGVFFQDGAGGTLLENDIHHNWVGVEACDDAQPTVRGNKLHHQKMGGVWVYKEAGGVFEDNDIFGNAKAAVRVYDYGNPTVTGNRIYGGRGAGVLVYEFGRGTYTDNEIHHNRGWNVEIKRNCAPLFERNRVHAGHPGGFYCHGEGDEGYDGYCLPTINHNEIYDNEGPGINVGSEAYVKATGNTIRGGKAGLLMSGARSKGMFVENIFEANMDGVVLREGACPTLERNQIREQTRRGVLVCARGQGMIVDNDIAGSVDANVEVRGELQRAVPEDEAKDELEKKKRVYASLGMLVPVSKDGVTIAGLLTDESGATSVTLRNNRVSGGGVGVRLADNAKGFVKENVVVGCAGHGIEVSGGADPDVVANELRGCGADGLHVGVGGKGRYQNNVCRDCRGSGVVIEGGAEPDMRANELQANGAHGVLVEAGGGGRLSANRIHHNAGFGVKVVGREARTHLRSNRVEACAAGGVHIVGARDVVMVENEVVGNEGAGVWLSEGADPLLEKNTVSENGAQGVLVEGGAHGRLLRNVVECNGAQGVLARDGCAPVLGENFVRRNTGGDFEGATQAAAAGNGAVPRTGDNADDNDADDEGDASD